MPSLPHLLSLIPGSPASDRQAPGGAGYPSTAAPPGTPGSSLAVHQAGGDVLAAKRDEQFSPVYCRFAVTTTAAMYDPNLSSAKPVVVDLGVYEVPKEREFWCYDYSFSIYVLSGVQAGRGKLADPGEFIEQVVFDLSVNGTHRQANLQVDITPRPVALGSPLFTTAGGARTQQQILRARQQVGASVTGFGLSSLPAISETYAPRGMTPCVVAKTGDFVVMRAAVISPLLLPVEEIVGELKGYEMSSQLAAALAVRTRPA